eukprot:TRINITY_DN55192_c0_g1_i1.p2 TRINITY_DN55192_c0_g1~~TRINITY_DN55192_c0_g1_i1.p2  ORF type:complete len:147 (-),score=21.20 TRINITY_DN55192_c0_g1_i1:296-736(-)
MCKTLFNDEFKIKRSDLEAKINQCQKIVSLNVGGTHFETTERTLLKEKETFFWAMLHSGEWKPDDKDDGYFIDRSPQLFSHILDYLRDTKVPDWEQLSPDAIKELQTEFDFYQVPFPVPPTGCYFCPAEKCGRTRRHKGNWNASQS